ncbi:hypothetical protein D3C79_1008200 [compost metagenome]
MKVYELNRAPNARRVRMFLAEKGTVGEECKQQALAGFARLDARLAEVPYVAGDRFTIADILALCTIGLARSSLFASPRTSITCRPGMSG